MADAESMVERVARAMHAVSLAAEDEDELKPKGWDDENDEQQALFRAQARAAIEAMREPTDLMGNGLPDGYRPGSHSATAIWKAYIAAALKNEPAKATPEASAPRQ